MNTKINTQYTARQIALGILAEVSELIDDEFTSAVVGEYAFADFDKRTIAGLVRSGCIEKSNGVSGANYRITRKGYEQAPKGVHFDATSIGVRIFNANYEFTGWMK